MNSMGMCVKKGRKLVVVVCDFNKPEYEYEYHKCIIHKTHDCPLLCVEPDTDFGKLLLKLINQLKYFVKRTNGEFE